jgi:hypothetical protein
LTPGIRPDGAHHDGTRGTALDGLARFLSAALEGVEPTALHLRRYYLDLNPRQIKAGGFKSATEYFGGTDINMCTWSGIKYPSSIRHSLCSASS